MLARGFLPTVVLLTLFGSSAVAGTRTWDERHSTERITLTVVYFVPSDRTAIGDWKDRASYYCDRIAQFHEREFQGQSKMTIVLHPKPFVSERTTPELREGDANRIFFRTLREVDQALKPQETANGSFPILLVLSEINWRPLDDFYRVKPTDNGPEFEGNYNRGQHFPGATSGGARATYLAREGKGWGLVSADGWRVPYRGSDCVVYHEGVGHTVGLPHPQPGNASVMSLGQYRGWISESWLNKDQKVRMKWEPPEEPVKLSPQLELFTRFRAIPQPLVPKPGEQTNLALDWPEGALVKSLTVRYQTAIDGEWKTVPQRWEGNAPAVATLGTFSQETPISYRVDAVLEDGSTAELWGYLQVRQNPRRPVMPPAAPTPLRKAL